MFANGALTDPYQLFPVIQSPAGTSILDIGGSDYTGRTPVKLTNGLSREIILSFGQSYATNSATGGYTVTQSENQQFSIHNGLIYPATPNILGCSNVGDGVECFLAPLGDRIVLGGVKQSVLFISISIGGTNFGQWAKPNVANGNSGFLNHRFNVTGKRLKDAGLTCTRVMCSMGGGDASLATTKANCKTYIQSVRDSLNDNNIIAPLYLEQCTFIGGVIPAGSAAVRTAMSEMVNGTTILLGPDTDIYDGTYRHDGAHWNLTGEAVVSHDWQTTLGL